MDPKYKNLETCVHNRLLQINNNIRELRKQRNFSKEEMESLKEQRTSTDKLLSAIKNETLFNELNYGSLREQFNNAKIS